MNMKVDRLIGSAVRVRSIEDIRMLPQETAAVHLDVLDDDRAEALSRLPALRAVIHDGNSLLTDRGLSFIASLRSLEALDLEWSSGITDSGLESLTRLSELRYLDLSFCNAISAESVKRLQHALPHCEISR